MVDRQVNSNGKDFKLRRQEGLKQSFEKSSEELEVRTPAGLCRNAKRNPFWVDTIPQVLCIATECSFVSRDKNFQQGSWLEEQRVDGIWTPISTLLGSQAQGKTYIIPHIISDGKSRSLSLINTST